MGPLTVRKQKSVLGKMTDMLSSRGYCKGSIPAISTFFFI